MYEELTARYVHEAGGILPDQPPWPISAIISLLPPIPHHPLAYKRFMSQRLEWRLSAEEVAFVGLATIVITLMRVICFKTVFAVRRCCAYHHDTSCSSSSSWSS